MIEDTMSRVPQQSLCINKYSFNAIMPSEMDVAPKAISGTGLDGLEISTQLT